MKHETRWDADNGCGRMNLVGELAPDQVDVILDRFEVYFQGQDRRLMLVDFSASPGVMSRATRRQIEARMRIFAVDRTAFFGVTNLNRVVAKIILTVTGKPDQANFFKSEAEALSWLHR